MCWSGSSLKFEDEHQRRRYDCHHEDGADHPKPPTTPACLLEKELSIECLDKGWLVKQSHGRLVLANGLVITRGAR